jgi:hypothetical protein
MNATPIKIVTILFFLFFLPIRGWASPPQDSIESATLIFLPYVLSSATPLDKQQLAKVGCTFTTKNSAEIERLRSMLSQGMSSSTAAPRQRGFIQAIIFYKNNHQEEFYFSPQTEGEYKLATYFNESSIVSIKFQKNFVRDMILAAPPESYHQFENDVPRIECSGFTKYLDNSIQKVKNATN